MTFAMRVTQIRLREGERIPRGYGLAWYLPEVAEAVFLPVPFNWLAALGRRAWFFLVRGPKQDERTAMACQAARSEGFSRGYDAGWKAGAEAGKRDGWDQAFKHLDTMLDGRQ